METSEKRKIGKKSRAAGKRFENLVRIDLEKQGWIVSKWNNNIEFTNKIKVNEDFTNHTSEVLGRLIQTKPKFNPFTKSVQMMSGGFPDFICYSPVGKSKDGTIYIVIGVESKMSGVLDKLEKEKAKWLIENNVFNKILIAKKSEKRGTIEYETFEIKE